MSQPWPPPPDLASIQDLVREADIEGFLAEGAPSDEYDTEAELLFRAIENFPTDEIESQRLVPILEAVWRKSFSLEEGDIARRRTGFDHLAAQIARFFGPEAVPQVRGS